MFRPSRAGGRYDEYEDFDQRRYPQSYRPEEFSYNSMRRGVVSSPAQVAVGPAPAFGYLDSGAVEEYDDGYEEESNYRAYIPARGRVHDPVVGSVVAPSRSGSRRSVGSIGRIPGPAATYSGAFGYRTDPREEVSEYSPQRERSPRFQDARYQYQQPRYYEEPFPVADQDSFEDGRFDDPYVPPRSYGSPPFEPNPNPPANALLTMPGVYAPPVVSSVEPVMDDALPIQGSVVTSPYSKKTGSKDGLLPRKSISSESLSGRPVFNLWQKALAATSKLHVGSTNRVQEAEIASHPQQPNISVHKASLVRPREVITVPSEPPTKKAKAKKGRGSTRTRDAAFLYFVTSEREKMQGESARAFNDCAKDLSERWKNMTDAERQRYAELSQADKLRYQREKAQQEEKNCKASSAESAKS